MLSDPVWSPRPSPPCWGYRFHRAMRRLPDRLPPGQANSLDPRYLRASRRGGCGARVQIFIEAPEVHILATSREALRVEGEHVYRLDALACPPTIRGLRRRLFRRSRPPSSSRAGDGRRRAPGVSDGTPRSSGASAATRWRGARHRIGGQTRRSFWTKTDRRASRPTSDPVVAGAANRATRQKTLQATLDWSFGLLGELERMVLRRLAVFVGHFTLDAALEVVSSATLDRPTVFSAIDSLVAKSIVATRPVGAMMRYWLLDTHARLCARHQNRRRGAGRPGCAACRILSSMARAERNRMVDLAGGADRSATLPASTMFARRWNGALASTATQKSGSD